MTVLAQLTSTTGFPDPNYLFCPQGQKLCPCWLCSPLMPLNSAGPRVSSATLPCYQWHKSLQFAVLSKASIAKLATFKFQLLLLDRSSGSQYCYTACPLSLQVSMVPLPPRESIVMLAIQAKQSSTKLSSIASLVLTIWIPILLCTAVPLGFNYQTCLPGINCPADHPSQSIKYWADPLIPPLLSRHPRL